jgi:hypothetical protein
MQRVLCSYYDFLQQLSLQSEAIELIKYLPVPNEGENDERGSLWHVRDLKKKQPQVIVNLKCPQSMDEKSHTVGSICDGCQHQQKRCVLCEMPVKSMYLWCQVCSHGGHENCLQRWFKARSQCPTACGHNCVPVLEIQ